MPVVSGLEAPVEVGNAADGSGRLFVVEQGGRIRIVRANALLPTPLLDLSALVVSGGEQGLLGLAFHPQFRSNGRFFVNYTRSPDGATVIASYRVSATNPDVGDPSTAQILLVIPQPFANHNGGTLRFGPDGYLYIGMGDGGSGNDPDNRAQDLHSLLGKLLRIDVDHDFPYTVPPSNPFFGSTLTPEPAPEIFASGLRNPWKYSFDRLTGDLYIGDVGQDAREEVDFVPAGTGAGANFGWRVMEGLQCTMRGGVRPCGAPEFTAPVFDYGHDQGCSITGGYVYRGAEAPSLFGRYVFADYCSGRFWVLSRNGAGVWTSELLFQRTNGPTSFGEDEQGNVYFTDATTGTLLRLADDAPPIVSLVEYYNAALDHYFITSLPAEIDALDRGLLKGWMRTGHAFSAYAWATSAANAACRFYLPPGLGDSHFYSVSAQECADVARRYPAFVLETWEAFALQPAPGNGMCPDGLVPVYRLWNARADTNHRYTTDPAVRDQMVARGYVVEGNGPSPVGMCAPTS